MTNELRKQLKQSYDGVFTQSMLEKHIGDHVDGANVHDLMAIVEPYTSVDASLLDIGSGYGAFVRAARARGMNAKGIDISEFEIDEARKRLSNTGSSEDPEDTFRLGDSLDLPFPDNSFDAVTLWNSLEHVKDSARALAEAVRVLRPGGRLFLIAPNYLAFRREPHYHVIWFPMLPRRVAIVYLRLRGRNSAFFENNIHYCSNWGIRKELAPLSISVIEPEVEKVREPARITNYRARAVVNALRRIRLAWATVAIVSLRARNPFRSVIYLHAVKGPKT